MCALVLVHFGGNRSTSLVYAGRIHSSGTSLQVPSGLYDYDEGHPSGAHCTPTVCRRPPLRSSNNRSVATPPRDTNCLKPASQCAVRLNQSMDCWRPSTDWRAVATAWRPSADWVSWVWCLGGLRYKFNTTMSSSSFSGEQLAGTSLRDSE